MTTCLFVFDSPPLAAVAGYHPALAHLGVVRIEGHIEADNTPSRCAVHRAGFVEEDPIEVTGGNGTPHVLEPPSLALE